MPKVQSRSEPDTPPSVSPPRPLTRIVVVLVCLSPLIFEGGLRCYERWTAILGRVRTVRTPVLDAIGDFIRGVSSETSAFFRNVPWDSNIVIAVGFACFAICGTLLRVRRDR